MAESANLHAFDPLVLDFWAKSGAQLQDSLKGFDPLIAAAAGARTTADSALATNTADQLANEAAGPAPMDPRADFLTRLFGNVSQAIAPSMRGAALAEDNLGQERTARHQKFMERSRRLEALHTELASAATKAGDYEKALTHEKELQKLIRESENLQKGYDLEQHAQAMTQQRELAGRAERAAATTGHYQIFKQEMADAQRERDAAFSEYNRLVSDKEGKKNKPAIQSAINRVYLQNQRANDLELKVTALTASIDPNTGMLNGGLFKKNLTELQTQNETQKVNDTQDKVLQVLAANPDATEIEVVNAWNKEHMRANQGIELPKDDIRRIRKIYGELRAKLPAGQASQPAAPRRLSAIPGRALGGLARGTMDNAGTAFSTLDAIDQLLGGGDVDPDNKAWKKLLKAARADSVARARR